MIDEDIAFRGTVMAGKTLRDGNTERSRKLAQRMVDAGAEDEDGQPISNGEGVFACAVFLATCMTKLSVQEKMVVAVSCGNVALELAKGMDAYEAEQAKTEGAPI